jgi:putative membrane protein
MSEPAAPGEGHRAGADRPLGRTGARQDPSERGGRTDLPYPARLPGYLLGGGLVGAAEVVPGVSGGTLALVVGLYDRLITGADHVVRGVVALVRPGRGPSAARQELSQVRWSVLLPVGVGMVAAVVLGAAAIEPLLEDYPVGMRALFFGFIAASVVVPLRMAGWARTGRDWAVLVAAAVAAALLTSLPPGDVSSPFLPLVALAAAVAVCALVLPGVSGSFFLLSIGLYDRTIQAVNERDVVYLGVFALGAVLGLASFVRVVRWLLAHHRHVTLLAMAGLMVGSLRALWPWQTEDRGLLPPDGGAAGVLGVVGIALAGAVVVLALTALDARLQRQGEQLQDPVR